MTGQYAPHNGVYHVQGGRIPRARSERNMHVDPYYPARVYQEKTIIPEVLKKAGYITAHVGKWHLSGASGFPTPIQQGFDFSMTKIIIIMTPIYMTRQIKEGELLWIVLTAKEQTDLF